MNDWALNIPILRNVNQPVLVPGAGALRVDTALDMAKCCGVHNWFKRRCPSSTRRPHLFLHGEPGSARIADIGSLWALTRGVPI